MGCPCCCQAAAGKKWEKGMNPTVCGEPQGVCGKKDVTGEGPERAGNLCKVTRHVRGTTKVQVAWVVALAIPGDTSCSLHLDIWRRGWSRSVCSKRRLKKL